MIKTLEERILGLRSQNKTYTQISQELGCPKSTISYYCNPETRIKMYKRQRSRTKRLKLKAISYKGGKCQRCDYNKCSRALSFHHRDPKQKDPLVNLRKDNWEIIQKELDKCDLLCANCHMEIHEEIQNVGPRGIEPRYSV